MAPIFSLHNLYTFFFSRLQTPVASHRHFSSLARRLGRFLALTERFELVQAGFLVYRRMAIMLEVLEIHWGLHLLDHLGMNIDDQTSLTEVIPNSSNNHNNNGLDMIQIFRNRTQVHLRLPLLNRV